jgi:hypothetical protein
MGVDMTAKCVLWVTARPDYEPLFSILDGFRVRIRHSFWMSEQSIEVNTCDIGEDMVHTVTEVKIALPMSHKTLTYTAENIQ